MSQRKKKLERKLEKVKAQVKEVFVAEWESSWGVVKMNWKFLGLICILIFGVYLNSLKGDFVSDDYATITQNPLIGNLGYMFNKGNSMFLSNYLVFKLFGHGSSLPYHALSLMLYMVASVISFVFVKIIIKDELVAKISTLLFAVLPIHVEAVAWISGRIYLFLAIYTMLSVLMLVGYLETKKLKYLIFGALFFVLGFLTDKPRPFAVIFIMFIYFIYKWKSVYGEVLKKYWWQLLGIIIVFVLMSMGYINTRINSVNSGYNSSGSVFYNPFFQYPTAMAKYLQVLAVPVDLTLYHTIYNFPVWLNWLILGLYVGLMVFYLFKDKRYFFGLAFIFAATAPSMAPVKVSWLMADRYMFLGSLGFCIFLGLILSQSLKKFKLNYLILIVLVAAYGVRTYYRNIDWQTNHKLWVNTVQVSSNSHNAWNNIGDDYDKLGDLENAVKGFAESYRVKPNYADAYHNQANIFYKMRRLDLARKGYEAALSYSPGLQQTYVSLTQIDLNEGRIDLAIAHAQKAVELQPSALSYYLYAYVAAQAGNLDVAAKAANESLRYDASYRPALELLANIRSQT